MKNKVFRLLFILLLVSFLFSTASAAQTEADAGMADTLSENKTERENVTSVRLADEYMNWIYYRPGEVNLDIFSLEPGRYDAILTITCFSQSDSQFAEQKYIQEQPIEVLVYRRIWPVVEDDMETFREEYAYFLRFIWHRDDRSLSSAPLQPDPFDGIRFSWYQKAVFTYAKESDVWMLVKGLS